MSYSSRAHAQIHALSSKRTGLVFLLWGKQAQDKAKKGTIQQATRQHILQSPHPSGLSAAKVCCVRVRVRVCVCVCVCACQSMLKSAQIQQLQLRL